MANRLLFVGARVYTANPPDLWAQAILVEGSKILYVGSEAEARRLAGAAAKEFDLNGGLVMPGFVDAHAHLLLTGDALLQAQLRDAKDLAEIKRRLVAWRKEHPQAKRVLGVGWQFSALPGAPRKEWLDDIFPDIPCYCTPLDFHSQWVNTAALKEMGLTKQSKAPIGGEFVLDAPTGELTGHLVENAFLDHSLPFLLGQVTSEQADAFLDSCFNAYNSTGVTSAVDMLMTDLALDALKRAEAAGKLNVRVIAHWFVRKEAKFEDELKQVETAAKHAAETQSDKLRVIGIKILVDGTIDGCTAATFAAYTTGQTAEPIWDGESLNRVVAAADKLGLQVAMHAIGDRAINLAINAIEHASKVNGTNCKRHRIEHLEYTDAKDVKRLAPLGITASMQPVHIDPHIHSNWARMLGEPRTSRGFAWREFLEAGTTLVFGSDTPTAPHAPLPNMYIASTRCSPVDASLPPHAPHNALPMADAIVHATRDAAWASFLEGKVGALRPGLYADLLVLDRDPFLTGPSALLDTRVCLTLLGGEIVYDGRDSSKQ